ncbi:MAG TPA: ScpA family protein [Actinomycetota bacterium]|nr:ScpA family protein [Actinomycetota bacterium]
MAYEVKTEVFEGPLELLLHLITRQRVDIYEVSISTITDEYLKALERMEGFDLETATGFLVVAATLLELKSARLLPSMSLGEERDHLLEERDLLLARLVECATYRDAGTWLAAGFNAGAGFHGRTAGLEPQLVSVAPDLLASTSIQDLIDAAERIFAPRPVVDLDMSHVQPIRASVKDALIEVAGRLRSAPAGFDELCSHVTERIDRVVRFLALLELYKAGAVELSQADRFGDIRATWIGDAADDEELLTTVEEYAVEVEG